MIQEILSPYIIAFVSAWAMAHMIKYIISKIKKDGNGVTALLYKSGGLPSAHSATSVSVAVVIGLVDGFGSGLFALAALVSVIFMYDAMMVRRACGEQGVALDRLIKDQKNGTGLRYIAMGHTPVEVAVGMLLGVAVGIVVFFATNC